MLMTAVLLALGSVAVTALGPTRLASARELRHRGSRHASHSPLMTLATEEVDVVVVGGGAAGVFAAVAAARAGARVLCLEGGSKPLRKVRVSGGGRCNVMHDATTWEARVGSGRDLLSERYPRGADQLLGAPAWSELTSRAAARAANCRSRRPPACSSLWAVRGCGGAPVPGDSR